MALIKVGNFSQDITNFDPANDQLDFGSISVHSLILGQEPDGTATIVYPWQPNQFQRILGANGQGIQWSDLNEGNFAPVGNEHLRGDIGGVFSWEKGIGPAFDPGNPDRESTVYIRSHERDSVTTIENFDPVTDKINFLYFGTRERLSVVNEGADLVISSEPIGQRFVFKGVQKEELIGANLEFHFDQIQEDLLDRAFGFQPEQLSLVNRTMLFTPEGGPTDGFQTRVGAFVTASGEAPGQPRSLEESTRQIQERAEQQQAAELIPQETGAEMDMPMGTGMDMDMGTGMDMDMGAGMDMDMTPPDLTNVVMNLPSGSNVHNSCLQLEVDGSLWWGGGMGGNLIVRNPMGFAIDGWEVSFLTPHDQFQSWAGNATVEDLGNGLNRVTFTPAAWNNSIPANGEISISFNAQGVGISNGGELTRSNFFAPAQASMEMEMNMDTNMEMDSGMEVDSGSPADLEPTVDLQPNASGLEVSATITGGWSGTFAGNVIVTNNTDESLGTDWSVSFVSDAPLKSVSNFEFTNTLRDDGRYAITLMPKSWSAPLAAGAAQSSYYQGSGDFADPNQVFDLAATAIISSDTAQQPDSAESGDSSDGGATPPVVSLVTEGGANTEGVPVREGGTVTIDDERPNGTTDKRVVTYFEEWGIYGRDVNLSDVDGQSMTHMNYSFFDVKADGSITLFDPYAALQKRFDQSDQVSRTFSTSEYAAMAPELLDSYENSGRYTTTESGDSITVTSVPVGWNGVGDNDAGNFEQLRRFKELNPEVNLGFALGGWTLSDEFSTAYATQEGRDKFVSETVRIFETYDFFNVVDFDWEYPGGGGKAGNAVSTSDGENFALVLRDLRSALDDLSAETGRDFEVSIATAGGQEKLANLNLEGIDPYVDFYNVMTYDFHGGWENATGHQAAMTGDANDYDITGAVDVFEGAGVDLGKVVLGAPAYTRAWGNVLDGGTFGYQQPGSGLDATGSFQAGVYDYKDLLDDVVTGSRILYWDDDNKAAFLYDGDEWSSMETTATIAGKAAYVDKKGLGGMMFWALSNDAEGDASLVEAADDLLRQGASYAEVIGRAPEFDFIVGGDGQFGLDDFLLFA